MDPLVDTELLEGLGHRELTVRRPSTWHRPEAVRLEGAERDPYGVWRIRRPDGSDLELP